MSLCRKCVEPEEHDTCEKQQFKKLVVAFFKINIIKILIEPSVGCRKSQLVGDR